MSPAWATGRKRLALGLALTALLTLLLGLLLVRSDIAARREVFQAEARAAHRLLSQRMAQHEAILATLALNAQDERTGRIDLPLPPGFAQLLSAQRMRIAANVAPSSESQSVFRVEPPAASTGRYALVMTHQGYAYRLLIDLRRLLAGEGWPWAPDGPVQVSLAVGGAAVLLQPGAEPAMRPAGLTEGFRFSQALASANQPFELQARRWTGPAEWPWGQLALLATGCALMVVVLLKAQSLRSERQRAAELERLSKVARLNAMGELAAGMAHELNQPLTAMLSGTQAALRLLKEAQQDPASDGAADAVPALELAAAQARRAADVVARLRGLVKPPALGPVVSAVDLAWLVRGLFELLAPDFRARRIVTTLRGEAGPVRADRVALEQVLHNLLLNAMQALERAPQDHPSIGVRLHQRAGWVDCTVEDNGPGLRPEDQARVFEPFFTTRAEGLGLGLSLCQTLVQSMGGQLTVEAAEPHGALFCLSLPLAAPPSPNA